MPLPAPQPGLVIGSSYLWSDDAARGLTEGRKDRPAVIILAMEKASAGLVVTVAPVTHSAPRFARNAVEIPPTVKSRMGLDDMASWVITNEVNQFVWPGVDLRPINPDSEASFSFGILPRTLRNRIIQQVIGCLRDGSLAVVAR